MISPDEARARVDRINRLYTIRIRHDLRGWRLRPWSATIIHGLFHVGYPADLVWRARSREALVVRCERWARRNALRQGIRDVQIRTEDG